EGGSPPRGQERYPVTGVSWYEAAAYARFVGKQLPTIHQWRNAAGFNGNAWIVPKSNMESSALKPVGTGGMGPYGTFDMAGNAREWCWNAVGAQRHILGGAWSDPPWLVSDRVGAGGNAFGPGSSEIMTQTLPFVVASGRAVLYPVLRNMYERTDDRVNFGSGAIHNMSGELLGPNTYRDQLIMIMKDLRRSVDY